MSRKRQSRIHRKSRNRGRFASFTVHLVLLIAAFLPFISFEPPEEPTKEALVFQFDYPFNEYIAPEKFHTEEEVVEANELLEGSKMSGSEAGGNESVVEDPAPSRPQQAAPAPLATATPTQPVMKSMSNPIRTSVSDVPLPKPQIYTAPKWESIEEVSAAESDGVRPMRIIDEASSGSFGSVPGEGTGDGDDDSAVFSDGFGGKPGGQGGTGTGTGNTTGAGSGPGGGTGAGNAGSKTGVANDGMGFSVALDRLINRKLVSRAQVGQLAIKEGNISMYFVLTTLPFGSTQKYMDIFPSLIAI